MISIWILRNCAYNALVYSLAHGTYSICSILDGLRMLKRNPWDCVPMYSFRHQSNVEPSNLMPPPRQGKPDVQNTSGKRPGVFSLAAVPQKKQVVMPSAKDVVVGKPLLLPARPPANLAAKMKTPEVVLGIDIGCGETKHAFVLFISCMHVGFKFIFPCRNARLGRQQRKQRRHRTIWSLSSLQTQRFRKPHCAARLGYLEEGRAHTSEGAFDPPRRVLHLCQS